jgi:hypothetical protein
MSSGYRKLGLELISLGEERSCQPKSPSMEDEKRDDVVGYSINLFLEESLMQKRNEMMENFS